MISFKKFSTITGWVVFGIAMIVYFLSAERTGSLWDCGEFILGAYKLQVVHPPGAPLFLIVGRLFTSLADLLSSNPADIAFSVNLMSGMFTAFAAAFVSWICMTFARLAYVGREGTLSEEQTLAVCGAGLVAGLATAFSTSIWFSAVEGEVYAMSTFFTAMTFWAVAKWYGLPDKPQHDKWIIFALFSAGLSIGVHLLSLLTFPALALLFYFKKFKNITVTGTLIASAIGVILIPLVQNLVIVGIPTLWTSFELFSVNSIGLPFHSGIFPTLVVLFALVFFGLRWAHRREDGYLQMLIMGAFVLVIGFSTIGVVLIRANANPPINMNNPSDAMRLLPYLNREQYGERPLFRGPHFDAQPVDMEREDRYGRVGDRYEVVDQKISYVYRDQDKIFLPRISHNDQNRKQLHRMWMGDKTREPDMAYNISFLMRYQIGWMYMRYFMWNFAGRQNGEQGFYPWNVKSGHWLSGLGFLDSARLYNQSELPETMKKHAARNKYFLLPLIFGLIGMFYHFRRRKRDFAGLMMLFLFTGLGIIFYSNQPPNEPRERDYVLVGSFFTFCMWMGMAIPAIVEFARKRVNVPPKALVGGTTALVFLAPLIMCIQNFDDHSRRHHSGARDYASNFLESVEPNAIMFTYGDNDTYPLWYAQEVEGIRPDVRIVNLSLIAVDWYIEGLRRKVNESPALKLTIPAEAYRGKKRNQLFTMQNANREMGLDAALKIMSESHPVSGNGQVFDTYLPSKNLFIPVNRQLALQRGIVDQELSDRLLDKIPIRLKRDYITKDELAVLDVLMSNFYDRPIYFSVTCQQSKLLGLEDYMQLEGMGLRVVPVKSNSNKSFFIYGSGRVDTDKVYDAVMNKWRWGNFDKKELFVDNSYGASIQAQKMIIWRTALEMLSKGEPDKAVAITNKYFEAFPHMNFPYNGRTLPHINILVQGGDLESAKKHLRILAVELADFMEFYDSLSQEDLNAGFDQDQKLTVSTIREALRMSKQVSDEAYAEEITAILGPYGTTQQLQD